MEAELLRTKLRQDTPALKAFGDFIVDLVTTDLSRVSPQNILQIPPVCRVKNEGSLIEKALYRNKDYADAYNEITDKVGVRFVVLLVGQIKEVGEILVNCPSISCLKDRDLEERRRLRPTVFEYQSEHYVVTTGVLLNHANTTIPAGTQCEVQIRTLLQHAYAELSHTYLYKRPTGSNTPTADRCIARAMAHIETTDNLFMEVQELMHQQEEKIRKVAAVLARAYATLVPQLDPAPLHPLNEYLLDSYRDLIDEFDETGFNSFLSAEGRAIASEIETRYSIDLLFSLPVVLFFLYFLPRRTQRIIASLPIPEVRFRGVLSVKGVSPGA